MKAALSQFDDTALADLQAVAPLVEPLTPAPDAVDAFMRLADRRHALFLDSARRDEHLGRYSFVAVDPFAYVEYPAVQDAGAADAFTHLNRRLQTYRAARVDGLPPFQGGAAGLFSFDLCRQLERLPRHRADEFALPAMAVGLYDVVVAFDHWLDRAWIISHGLPETDISRRRRRAARRLAEVRALLSRPAADVSRQHADQAARARRGAIAPGQLVPQYPVARCAGLTSNFNEAAYLEAVRRAIEYVHAGDVFQVNLAQRLLYPAGDDSLSLYLRMRERNAATFAGYFDLGGSQICSASPERFLCARDGAVEARPIKGTRLRSSLPEADLYAGAELRDSEKDRAENVMIVDLLRNDLSRACRPESVRVTELCRLEAYEYVQHLVSVIEGRLVDGVSPLDLLRAAFPGGSITGAPKVRAIEIIAELEPACRGAYCGSLAYLGFDGTMDSSILIRTITAGRGWWQAPVGGGIVAQSDPQSEYQETWHKAEGLIRALR